MENERILVADDMSADQTAEGIEMAGKADGHQVVGIACSKEQLEDLLNGGLSPSIALVDSNFPLPNDGREAANIIRRLSPKTFVISLSSEIQKWGDKNWSKSYTSYKELVERITKLQH